MSVLSGVVLLDFVSVMRRKTSAIGWMALVLLSASVAVCAQTQSSGANEADKKDTGRGAFRVGGGVSAPVVIYSPDPEYSEQARAAHYQGVCVLWLVVGTDGLPRDIKVARKLGMGLDEQAISAVRTWKFKPSLMDGQPVAVQINVEVTFRLYEDPKIEALITRSNAGDSKASFELYRDYLAGNYVRVDEHRAIAFLETAAKRGMPKAQFMMGEYVSSHGNDLVTAYMWYALAQRSRYKHSDKKMKELAAKMSPEQLDEARHRVEATTMTPAKY